MSSLSRHVAGRRIAHLIECDGPGGAERVVAHLATTLQAAGAYNLAILPANGEGWLARELAGSGVAIEHFHLNRPVSPACARSLADAFRRHDIEVAHSHEFSMAVYGSWASWLAGVQHVITMHGSRYYAGRLQRRIAMRAAVALSGATVAVSKGLLDHMSRDLWLPRSRIAMVVNGVRHAEPEWITLRDELGLGPDDTLLVAVGNLYPVKGHRYAIDALALLARRYPRLHLAIAGRGDLAATLAKQASACGVAGRLHLLGLRSDIEAVLAAADIVVHPSLSEGLPLALLEAMFAARPIIASNVGEAGMALDGGNAGLLVEPGDPSALAAGIDRLLREPGFARALGTRARRRAFGEFDVHEMARRYASIYARTLSRPVRSRSLHVGPARPVGEAMTRTCFTLVDVFEARAEASAGKVAVVDGDRRVTYGDLHEYVSRLTATLRDHGVRKGDRVGIFLRRSVDAIAALFATWRAGAVAVILHEALRTRQTNHIVEHSEAVCVITDSRQMLGVPEFPCARVIRIDALETATGSVEPTPVIGLDLAALIYTSGSTGLPKGVMLSHDNLLSGAQIVAQYLGLTDRDVTLSILPFSFDYGLNQVLTAVLAGATVVIQHSMLPNDICGTILKEGITGLAGVPTLWLQLTGRLSPFLKRACGSLRYITNSGGRLPELTIRAIRAAHPDLRVFLMYGLTEAFRSTYLPPEELDRRPSSMGKAIPNVEILVIDSEGRQCRAGEVGELVHRGANVGMGYWRDPESTARVFRPHPLQDLRNGRSELVVFSGDLVTTDDEGYLYYVGRKDMQIKSRGVRVSPEEIERHLYASKLLAHLVVFPVPRADGENEIVVAVVPREPSTFQVESLREFWRREMPEYMWPRDVWMMPSFPLTSSGKPDRPAIRQLYVEHHSRTEPAASSAATA